MDILSAGFIVSLGNCTDDRDDQFAVFLVGIDIVIFEDDIDAKLVQFAQCGNNLYGVPAKAADSSVPRPRNMSIVGIIDEGQQMAPMMIVRLVFWFPSRMET